VNCIICNAPNAQHQAPSLLTFQERETVRAYDRSFVGPNGETIYHTGHLKTELMELPGRVCDAHRGPILPRHDQGYVCSDCGTFWLSQEEALHTPSECHAVRSP